MKKSVKILALLAAMATSMACFASCNNSNNGGSSSSGNSGSSGSSSSSDNGGNSANNGPAPTLKWLEIGTQPNDLKLVTEEMNKYSEEKINVKCEITFLDWNVWGDRISAILNSGEPFDIMFNDAGKYYNAINLGRFAELDDLLSEVPDLVNLIPEGVWDGVKVNGKIYGIPTYKDSSQTQYWVWDKKYVDLYDVDYKNIHSLADMEPTIIKYQEAIDKGEITITDYAFAMSKGINGFTMNYDSNIAMLGVRYNDAEGKVVHIYEQPDIMEWLEYLHKWYEAGYINPDAPTTTDSLKCLVSSAQGFPTAEIGWGADKEEGAVIEPWGGPVFSNSTILGSINSISAASNYKVEALKYLQLANCDPVMRNILFYGVEGVHYTLAEDGRVQRDPVKKDDWLSLGYQCATFFTVYPTTEQPVDMWDQVKAWIDTSENSVLLGFVFDRTSVENEIAACSAVISNYESNINTGAVDPHVAVPEMYAELEKVGLSTIQEELQNQVNAFLGK